jgi:hypothetical protein
VAVALGAGRPDGIPPAAVGRLPGPRGHIHPVRVGPTGTARGRRPLPRGRRRPRPVDPRKPGMVNNWLRRLREEASVVCYDRERGFFHAPRMPADGDSLIRAEGVEMTEPIGDRFGAKIREVVAIHDREIAAERAGAVPVTFLIVPSRGLLGRPAWYDLLPLSYG